jgi:hypothetical protein
MTLDGCTKETAERATVAKWKMGVNNLFTVLPDVTIDEAMAFEVMTAGQSIAIDASNWLHEYGAVFAINIVCNGDNTDLKRAWESRINQMIKHSITPIFCFDGLRNPGRRLLMETATRRAKRERRRRWNNSQLRNLAPISSPPRGKHLQSLKNWYTT